MGVEDRASNVPLSHRLSGTYAPRVRNAQLLLEPLVLPCLGDELLRFPALAEQAYFFASVVQGVVRFPDDLWKWEL